MRRQSLTKPRAFIPGFVARCQTLFVTRTFAFDHIEKINPVDLAIVVVAASFIPLQILVGQLKTQILNLRNGLVNKFLP